MIHTGTSIFPGARSRDGRADGGGRRGGGLPGAHDRHRPRRPAALDGAGLLPGAALPERLHGRLQHPAEEDPASTSRAWPRSRTRSSTAATGPPRACAAWPTTCGTSGPWAWPRTSSRRSSKPTRAGCSRDRGGYPVLVKLRRVAILALAASACGSPPPPFPAGCRRRLHRRSSRSSPPPGTSPARPTAAPPAGRWTPRPPSASPVPTWCSPSATSNTSAGELANFNRMYDAVVGALQDDHPSRGRQPRVRDPRRAGLFRLLQRARPAERARRRPPPRATTPSTSGRGTSSPSTPIAGRWAAATLGSPQEQFLRFDPRSPATRSARSPYLHHPLFSSGPNGSTPEIRPLWQTLYDFDADVVLNGHEHLYERFAPQTPQGVPDPRRGIRQFTVGTGGHSLTPFREPAAHQRGARQRRLRGAADGAAPRPRTAGSSSP